MGFQPMTSSIPVHWVLYQLSYQANWELVTLNDLSYIHAFVWAFAYYEFTNFDSEKIPFKWK